MIFDVYAGKNKNGEPLRYCGQLFASTHTFYSVEGKAHFSGKIIDFKNVTLKRVL